MRTETTGWLQKTIKDISLENAQFRTTWTYPAILAFSVNGFPGNSQNFSFPKHVHHT